jgi:hypothetical protein
MGETTDQIERHISEQRDELGDNIHELQQKVKTAVDWRAQVHERPGTMLAVAFGGGLLLSLFFGGKSSRKQPSPNWSSENYDTRSTDYNRSRRSERDDYPASSTWDNIRGAALAVAGTKLGAVLEEFLPGFQEQYRRKQQERYPRTSRPNGPENVWQKSASNQTDYNQS